MEKINSFEWFEQLLGFTEKKWNYQMETLPNFVLEKAGNFETKSIKELKENINLTNKEKIKSLRFIFRNKKTKENEEFFDTSELQYNAQEGTLFQVASNFNCMELGSEFRSAFSGKHITQLMVDQTQGPSAAGGAVYGTMLRISKHKEKEINLLEDTPLKPNNGKLYRTSEFPNFDPDLIKIGLHTNVGANFCRTDYKFEYNPDNVKINQVYTSTCIYNNRSEKNNTLAEILLTKAYEGTYLAGITTGCPKIVLTLIGGGVFHNPMELIIKSIIENHRKYSPYLQKDCQTDVPIYMGDIDKIIQLIKRYSNENDNIILEII
jgi:hypothetical protein